MTDQITSKSKAEKVAGITFLFFTLASILHYTLIELNLIVKENTGSIASFIERNELLFRFGIVLDLALFASGMVLSVALYVILRAVNRPLALLALIWILIETTLAVVIELSSFSALLLLNGKGYLASLESEELYSLLGLALNIRAAGYGIVTVFFCLGLILFLYLFFTSEYVPKLLAGWGLIAYSLLLTGTIARIIATSQSETSVIAGKILLVSSLLAMLFQIAIGLWLSFKPRTIAEMNGL